MRWFRIAVLLVLIAGAYVAWPMYAVLEIREAMRAGDTATLTRKVDWERVRTTLKATMTPDAIAALEADPAAPKPTLWQKVKSTLAPHMAGNVIDRYVTPEYFPVYLGYRRLWRGTSQPVPGMAPEPTTALAGTFLGGTAIDRFIEFYGRIRRAVFYSFSRFEIEVLDRHRADRTFTGTLELKNWEWKLVGLTIAKVGPDAAATSQP